MYDNRGHRRLVRPRIGANFIFDGFLSRILHWLIFNHFLNHLIGGILPDIFYSCFYLSGLYFIDMFIFSTNICKSIIILSLFFHCRYSFLLSGSLMVWVLFSLLSTKVDQCTNPSLNKTKELACSDLPTLCHPPNVEMYHGMFWTL